MFGNWIKTSILMAGIVALFGVVGGVIGGQQGMLLALVFGGAMNLWAYWFSDKMVLKMYRAREVDETTSPYLYNMVKGLAGRAGLPMPKVYIIDEAQPNAFATGRNPENAAVAATTGIIRTLSYDELAGVMAHELAHIKNHDTLTMTISATMAGAISTLASFGMFFGSRDNRPNAIVQIALMILAPLAATIIQMAISRSREYEADRIGGEICGNPAALADALAKIAGGVSHIPNETAEAKPATAHMFIINPLSGRGMDSLFSTHPDTGNRIAALMEQARAMGAGPTRGGFMSGASRNPFASGHEPGPWG